MNPDPPDNRSRGSARRFLWIFASSVLVIALGVASVNLFAFRYMLRDENQAIVQLLSGWGRIYKPILYDEIKPNVVAFGASWVRDAFDPIETGRLLELKFFNHGVSGGTPYETRRFGDSALGNHELRAAIINLDSFFRDERGARFKYGFDESILDIDGDGRPNRWVGLRRGYSLALGGWAVGANLKLISVIRARDSGAARHEYLRSYQIADLTLPHYQMDRTRLRVFPEPGAAPPEQEPPPPPRATETTELGKLIDGFCRNGIDVYLYFTPDQPGQACHAQPVEELAALEFLQGKQSSCRTKLAYYDFNYPNPVTLEGVLTPVTSSEYFRPNGHPRPTVGLLMAARMFEVEFPPGTPALLQQDFGVDLLARENPEGWLREHAARCAGDWGVDGFADYVTALTRGD